MASWLDHRLRPLTRMIFPADYSYEELDAAFQDLERYFEEVARTRPDEKVGLLVDTSAVTQSSARNRKRIADSMGHLGPLLGARALGQAFVMKSAVARGALTAIFWIASPGWPVKVFASRAEAEAWLRERFMEAGVSIRTE